MRVGIIRARWHDKICGDLVDGVKTSLKECGVSEDNIFESEVPGSFELPLATRYLALSNTVDVVVLLSAVDSVAGIFGVAVAAAIAAIVFLVVGAAVLIVAVDIFVMRGAAAARATFDVVVFVVVTVMTLANAVVVLVFAAVVAALFAPP